LSEKYIGEFENKIEQGALLEILPMYAAPEFGFFAIYLQRSY